jgi:hypothetical protein
MGAAYDETTYRRGKYSRPLPRLRGGGDDFRNAEDGGGSDAVIQIHNKPHRSGREYLLTVYRGLRCAGCGRGAMAVLAQHDGRDRAVAELIDFFPRSINTLNIPAAVPKDIKTEFRESELAGSVGAWRAASAMLRSTLEKTLKANGFTKGNLASKIDEAAADGVITEARAKRAHDDIRVLGNDVLHDAWREVTQEEFDLAHKYTQRILEDLYDDRNSVGALLTAKSRLPLFAKAAS